MTPIHENAIKTIKNMIRKKTISILDPAIISKTKLS